MKFGSGLIAAMALLAAPACAQVADASYKDADGGRVIKESVVVDAPRAEVWKAFVTDDIFVKWSGVGMAHITPGNGGSIEFGFAPTAKVGDKTNVINRIDVFLPGEMMIFHNEFIPPNPGMDPKTFGSLRTIMTFEDMGAGKTKVTETVVGFGTGASYDGLYQHLLGGNAEYLTGLVKFFGKKG